MPEPGLPAGREANLSGQHSSDTTTNNSATNSNRPVRDMEAGEKPSQVPDANRDSTGKISTDTASTLVSQALSVKAQAKDRSYWGILKQYPHLLIVPVIVLLVTTGLCVFGVVAATNKSADDTRSDAEAAARATADSFVLQLSQMYSAALTLGTHIVRNPSWTSLSAEFPRVAEEIFRQANATLRDSLTEVHVLPFGRVGSLWPPLRNVTTDLFNVARLRPVAIKNMVGRGVAILGPQELIVGGRLALLCRYPQFINNVSANETFNNPWNITAPTKCGPPPDDSLDCNWSDVYDESRRIKFWGFTVAVLYADSLTTGEDTRLVWLRERSYLYRMFKTEQDPTTGVNSTVIVIESDPPPPEDEWVLVKMDVPGATWYLAVYKEGGWVPNYRDPLIGLVCGMSFILSALLLLVIISHKKATLLFQDQLASNKALQDINRRLADTKNVLELEKQQRDALLARQYDLIACFARDKPIQDVGASVAASEAERKESMTMERIAAVRRAISERAGRSHQEEISTQDLLGEGTFGKVYKGLWRGTVVAVKTMVLPANMSGQEKREKMAIMEAAISSSLAHPNIVQTYTYTIKPVRDIEAELMAAAMVVSDANTMTFAGATSAGRSNVSTLNQTDKGIHSFEVRLVCEYCDRGCLRDALDLGAFLSGSGLNYSAILDSALDIAKAMLHLHCNNVLHADLKARNVMLSSAGNEGRGVRCKVADFGLAVRMEHNQSHMSGMFQGTFTHMAPEILLEGRVSKAADVYAFGITMWELFTGGHPFQGVPRALLGHSITCEHKRPAFPLLTPAGYRILAEACWHPKPEMRPSFEEVLKKLTALRSEQPSFTQPLSAYTVPIPQSQHLHKLGSNGAGQDASPTVTVPGSLSSLPSGVVLGGSLGGSLMAAALGTMMGIIPNVASMAIIAEEPAVEEARVSSASGGGGSSGKLPKPSLLASGEGSTASPTSSGKLRKLAASERRSSGGGKSTTIQLPVPPVPAGIIIGDGGDSAAAEGGEGGGGSGMITLTGATALCKANAITLPPIEEEKKDNTASL